MPALAFSALRNVALRWGPVWLVRIARGPTKYKPELVDPISRYAEFIGDEFETRDQSPTERGECSAQLFNPIQVIPNTLLDLIGKIFNNV